MNFPSHVDRIRIIPGKLVAGRVGGVGNATLNSIPRGMGSML